MKGVAQWKSIRIKLPYINGRSFICSIMPGHHSAKRDYLKSVHLALIHIFKQIDEIRRMGAQVTIDDRIAVVQGVERLTGAQVKASDLRAGAALIIAGLMAEGTTEIYNIKYVDRGYDHIEDKLIALGADISRVPAEEEELIELDLDFQ